MKNITPEEIATLKIIGLFGGAFIIVTNMFAGMYGIAMGLLFIVIFYVTPTSRLDKIYKKEEMKLEISYLLICVC